MMQQRVLLLFCVFLGASLAACRTAGVLPLSDEERAAMGGAPASIEEYEAMKDWRAAGSPLGEPMKPHSVVITEEQRENAAALDRPTDEHIAKQKMPEESSSTYKDASGKIIMQKDSSGTYRDASGKITMQKDSSGTYRDASGKITMQKDSSGTYRDASGKIIMQEDSSGTYRDASGKIIMQKDSLGIYRDASGKIIMREN